MDLELRATQQPSRVLQRFLSVHGLDLGRVFDEKQGRQEAEGGEAGDHGLGIQVDCGRDIRESCPSSLALLPFGLVDDVRTLDRHETAQLAEMDLPGRLESEQPRTSIGLLDDDPERDVTDQEVPGMAARPRRAVTRTFGRPMTVRALMPGEDVPRRFSSDDAEFLGGIREPIRPYQGERLVVPERRMRSRLGRLDDPHPIRDDHIASDAGIAHDFLRDERFAHDVPHCGNIRCRKTYRQPFDTVSVPTQRRQVASR